MAFSYRGGDRTQQFLVPPSLDDWVPQDHLARFVVAAVERLDLSRFERPARADGRGRRAYGPKMLVALVLLAWCEGRRSSRLIERCCRDAISYRWVTGNEIPDHTTISRFVKNRANELDDLFGQVLRLAVAAGMGQVGVVSIDGTKMAADASPLNDKTRAWIDNEVARIREEHQANDAADDKIFGEDRGDEMPPDVADPGTRDERISQAFAQMRAEDQAAREAYETKQATKDPKRPGRPAKPPEPTTRKANITDPDARTMRGPRNFYPAYNAQAAVTEDQLIVATTVTQDRNDSDQFIPMATTATNNLSAAGAPSPAMFAADAGYWNPHIFDLETTGPGVLVPPAPHPNRTKLATRGPIPKHATLAQRRERNMALKATQASYAKRKITVEPVFGQIRTNGMNRFRRRGLQAARHEWNLTATAHNLRKMFHAGFRFTT